MRENTFMKIAIWFAIKIHIPRSNWIERRYGKSYAQHTTQYYNFVYSKKLRKCFVVYIQVENF